MHAKTLIAFVFLTMVSFNVFADISNWDNITRLRRGTKVIVVLHSGDAVKGKIGRTSEDHISIDDGSSEVLKRFNREDVYQILRRGGGIRGWKVGAAIGGAIGTLFGVMVSALGDGDAGGGVGVALAFTGIGAAAGLPFNSEKRLDVIYSAPLRFEQ